MTFLPDLATLAAFTAAALVLVVTPGPDMLLFMSKTLTHGRAAGLIAVLGASSGLVIHTVLAALGVSVLLSASPPAFLLLKVAGAGYLIWLAVQAIRRGSGISFEATEASRQPLHRVWLQAVGVNILNPKIVLFFVTFLPQFVSASDPDAAGKLMFLGFYFVLLGIPVCLLLVLGAAGFARFLQTSPGVIRAFDWAFAGIMGAFALKLLVTRANS